MKKLILFLILLQLLAPAQAQDCTSRDFERLMADAKRLAKAGEYDKAINKLQSAKTCQPQREAEVSAEVLRVFEQVNKERKRAQEQTKIAEAEIRTVVANDLVFKSQIAISNGDRSTAFRLVQFAYNYVDSCNSNVIKTALNCIYNESPNQFQTEPWHSTICRQEGTINCIAFSPDANLIASSSEDKTVKIWDIKSGDLQKNLFGHSGVVNFIVFAPNGASVATCADDNTIKIWNLESGKEKWSFTGHGGTQSCLAFSPDGLKIAGYSNNNNTIEVWDLMTGKSLDRIIANKGVIALVYLKDGQSIAAWLNDGTIGVFSSGYPREIKPEQNAWRGIFSYNGEWGVSGNGDGKIRIVNIQTGEVELMSPGFDCDVLAISNDGMHIALTNRSDAYDNQSVYIWSRYAEKIVLRLKVEGESIGGRFLISDIDFNTEKYASVISDKNSEIKIWDIESYETRRNTKRYICSDSVSCIDFSNNSRMLAIAKFKSITILDLDNGVIVGELNDVGGVVSCMSFSPNTSQLAFGLKSGMAKIWDIGTGMLLSAKVANDSAVNKILFSIDGKQFIVNSKDSTLSVWDIRQNQILFNKLICSNVTCFFSGGNRVLGVEYKEDVLNISDLLSGESLIIKEIEGINDVNEVVFSNSGGKIAFFTHDGIQVWDLKRRKLLHRISNQLFRLHGYIVAFSRDEKRIASIHDDGRFIVWNLEFEKEEYAIKGIPNFYCKISQDWSKIAAFSYKLSDVEIVNLNIAECFEFAQRKRNISPIGVGQLKYFNLNELLDLRLNNESILLATRETWQIAAFADLYTQKIAQTGFPQKADYERAQRLYRACLSHNVDNAYFQQKIDDLERLWKDKNN